MLACLSKDGARDASIPLCFISNLSDICWVIASTLTNYASNIALRFCSAKERLSEFEKACITKSLHSKPIAKAVSPSW